MFKECLCFGWKVWKNWMNEWMNWMFRFHSYSGYCCRNWKMTKTSIQFNLIQFDSIRASSNNNNNDSKNRHGRRSIFWKFNLSPFFFSAALPLLVNYIWIRRKSFLVFFFFIFTFFARNISRKTKLSEVIMWSSLITYQLFNQTTTNRKKRS